jgi:hypothetical protein
MNSGFGEWIRWLHSSGPEVEWIMGLGLGWSLGTIQWKQHVRLE